MKRHKDSLIPSVENAIGQIQRACAGHQADLKVEEIGIVHTVATGVARVSGLHGVGYEELVQFEGGEYGIAFNLDEDDLGVILLCDSSKIVNSSEVRRTRRVMDVPVGDQLPGRVINPLGFPLDEGPPIVTSQRFPVEQPAPAITDRAPVTKPLQTGIKAIDALIPVGRGQRELILGDRQTGKTAIALDTIVNQKDSDVICIYCTIGQRASSVAKALGELRLRGALDYTIAVVTEGNDAPGLRYVAPYAATSIAEYFMRQGRDVLIVYDDLTHHARAYRELSLLLRRPPGREAYPGDIFYIHSRLLERSTHLIEPLGGGSLTAFPIIETEAENISDYIPTNLISITDGQIYLSPGLFELGVLPAIDIGKSVSRVGGKAQLPAFHKLAGPLKLAYSQFEEMEVFARFGTRLDNRTRGIITHGKRIRAILQQAEFEPLTVSEQVVLLLALTAGLFDTVAEELMPEAEMALRSMTQNELSAELYNGLSSTMGLNEADRIALLELAGKSLEKFNQTNG